MTGWSYPGKTPTDYLPNLIGRCGCTKTGDFVSTADVPNYLALETASDGTEVDGAQILETHMGDNLHIF